MARYLEFAAARIRSHEWEGIRDVPMPGCRVYDLTDLPIKGIEDNTYDGIYSEHFIEHLEKDEGERLIEECMRILKPGGVLRTCWPPMEVVNRLMGPQDLSEDEFVKHYYEVYVKKHKFAPPETKNLRIQEQVAHGLLWQKGEHKYLWSIEELVDSMKQLGYTRIKQMNYQNSRTPAFNNLETPGRIRELHSAVVEGYKSWV